MAVHGVPRATGDLDVWISPDPANSERVWQALLAFGAPVGELGVSREDLEAPGMVVQIGMPPRRIDLLTKASGLDFDEAWRNRTTHRLDSYEVPFLSREDLVRNKKATGRAKDLADLDVLERERE
jgi:hypothetical protein